MTDLLYGLWQWQKSSFYKAPRITFNMEKRRCILNLFFSKPLSRSFATFWALLCLCIIFFFFFYETIIMECFNLEEFFPTCIISFPFFPLFDGAYSIFLIMSISMSSSRHSCGLRHDGFLFFVLICIFLLFALSLFYFCTHPVFFFLANSKRICCPLSRLPTSQVKRLQKRKRENLRRDPRKSRIHRRTGCG